MEGGAPALEGGAVDGEADDDLAQLQLGLAAVLPLEELLNGQDAAQTAGAEDVHLGIQQPQHGGQVGGGRGVGHVAADGALVADLGGANTARGIGQGLQVRKTIGGLLHPGHGGHGADDGPLRGDDDVLQSGNVAEREEDIGLQMLGAHLKNQVGASGQNQALPGQLTQGLPQFLQGFGDQTSTHASPPISRAARLTALTI